MEVNFGDVSDGEVEKGPNVEEIGEEETSDEDCLKDVPAPSESEKGDALEEAEKSSNEALVEELEDVTNVESLAGTSVSGTWLVVFGAVTGTLVNGAEDSGIWSDG